MKQEKDIHWWSSPRRLLRAILMLDDSSHSIALGTAIGMFIGMTPTVGIQIILVLTLAFFTRRLFWFNRTAAVLTVYISNPVTMAPLYWFDYKVGEIFVGGNFTYDSLVSVLKYHSFQAWLHTIKVLFHQNGVALVVGGLIVGVISGCITYPVMRWLLSRVRSTIRTTSKERRREAAEV